MPTPLTTACLLVHWIARPLRPTRDMFGNIDPRANELGFSARDFCHWARANFPAPERHLGQILHGTVWQGLGGSDNPQRPARHHQPRPPARLAARLQRSRPGAAHLVRAGGPGQRREHRRPEAAQLTQVMTTARGRRGPADRCRWMWRAGAASGRATGQRRARLLGQAARQPAQHACRRDPRLPLPRPGPRGLYHCPGPRGPTACTRWSTQANFSPAAKHAHRARNAPRLCRAGQRSTNPLCPCSRPTTPAARSSA